jgi:hypothetical protein
MRAAPRNDAEDGSNRQRAEQHGEVKNGPSLVRFRASQHDISVDAGEVIRRNPLGRIMVPRLYQA